MSPVQPVKKGQLTPIKVNCPPEVQVPPGSLLFECYRVGECGVFLSRDDIADARSQTRDFRWHLSIAHPTRLPSWDEIKTARSIVDEKVHFCMPFPAAGYWLNVHEFCFHLWEIKDKELTEQWEYDSAMATQEGINRGA